ncbi:sodium-coupled monocarboxylate transporter 2 [Ixodes scapularis]
MSLMVRGVHLAEYAVFGILMGANLAVGLYFALNRRSRRMNTDEAFLGSRTLGIVPLSLSILATQVSAIGVVGFTAHFYTYGLHLVWSLVPLLFLVPVISRIVVPVFYNLKITSVFEGGFRGVIWTDTMQAILILVCPLTVVIKIIYDSSYGPDANLRRPVDDVDIQPYFLEASFDLTKEENVWACIFGSIAPSMYRMGVGQMIVQRYAAAKSLQEAQSTVYLGSTLFFVSFALLSVVGMSLIYWYRDCDPFLLGAISRVDQVHKGTCRQFTTRSSEHRKHRCPSLQGSGKVQTSQPTNRGDFPNPQAIQMEKVWWFVAVIYVIAHFSHEKRVERSCTVLQ